MLKVWFDFSNAVNRKSSFLAAALLLFQLVVPSWAIAEEATTPSPLPTLDLKVVQKNANGEQYQIGDRVTLFVEINPEIANHATDLSLSLPKEEKKLADQGWYLDSKTQFTANVLRFVVSPIQKGKLTLPSLLIQKEDQTPIAKTTSWSIQVNGPEKKEKESELIDIVPISLPTKYLILFAVITLLVLICAVVITKRYLKSRKLKTRQMAVPVMKKESDHALALRSLELLFKKYPFSYENLKPVSFGISEILKNFFSSRFTIDAREATTDEMIALLRKEAIPREGLQEILNLFNDLDLIKFTKESDSGHFKEHHYQDFKIKAQSIIQKWALHTGGTSL